MRYIRSCGLDLVLQTAHHIALALHHGIETVIGDLGGAILFGDPDRGYPSSPHVTVTLVSLSSSRSANEKEFRKALVPL